ncbi:hypothetical protein BC834DRAFT_888622 [Gloeopeniophorella convolvens]|nr:hypothetical protein BC834DRAFT_888622 [Gloeopeniophorella convolvens]
MQRCPPRGGLARFTPSSCYVARTHARRGSGRQHAGAITCACRKEAPGVAARRGRQVQSHVTIARKKGYQEEALAAGALTEMPVALPLARPGDFAHSLKFYRAGRQVETTSRGPRLMLIDRARPSGQCPSRCRQLE